MADDVRRVTLTITPAQEAVVRALFEQFDWEYNATITPLNTGGIGESGITYARHAGLIPQDQSQPECPMCLCRPCITQGNHQSWWRDEPVRPHLRNSNKRKFCYKKFWAMLLHRGVWLDPRYLDRKRLALERDPRLAVYVYHRRELMPNCVLDMVRLWYPNPQSVPYMGHRWQ